MLADSLRRFSHLLETAQPVEVQFALSILIHSVIVSNNSLELKLLGNPGLKMLEKENCALVNPKEKSAQLRLKWLREQDSNLRHGG